jgi:hypothetical protein
MRHSDHIVRVCRQAGWIVLIGWLSLGEWRVLRQLAFQLPASLDFVLVNVQGVLVGTPVSKSWQQRFLATGGVTALDPLTGSRLHSLMWFALLSLLAANLLLFALMRRKGATQQQSLYTVIAFGFAHLVLAYRLEYPWDALDSLLFLLFGYHASRQRSLLAFMPWLLLGTFNHETVLYIPAWYLLAAIDRARPLRDVKRDAITALGCLAAIGGAILFLREHFYRGQPALPPQSFEPSLPVIGNHQHVAHNLNQLLHADWHAGRGFISLGFLGSTVLLLWLALTRKHVTAAWWSLGVLVSIVVFGYVNETRHYLILVAFWFAYACGPAVAAAEPHADVAH